VNVTDLEALRALAGRGSLVSVGHSPEGGVDAVVADDFEGAYRVASEALALGHSAVAVLAGPAGHSAARARRRAAAAALNEPGRASGENAGPGRRVRRRGRGSNGSSVTWTETGWGIDDGHAAARSILDRKRRRVGSRKPTLFVCWTDCVALGVIRAAHEVGLAVPRDVSVTGFGGDSYGPGFRPRLTSARVDPYVMGAVAAERLLELLRGPAGPTRVIVLPAAYVPGETIAIPRR
jgi:LacI family sucrose operon transcriptional repressor